jgi:hypothetical protein
MENKQKSLTEGLSEPLQQCSVRRSSSINVAQNIFDKYFISTAMWATEIQGMRYPTYETFIWEYNKETRERGKLLKQYYHPSRGTGLKFHFRFCQLLSYMQLKQKLPSDAGWVDFD